MQIIGIFIKIAKHKEQNLGINSWITIEVHSLKDFITIVIA